MLLEAACYMPAGLHMWSTNRDAQWSGSCLDTCIMITLSCTTQGPAAAAAACFMLTRQESTAQQLLMNELLQQLLLARPGPVQTTLQQLQLPLRDCSCCRCCRTPTACVRTLMLMLLGSFAGAFVAFLAAARC